MLTGKINSTVHFDPSIDNTLNKFWETENTPDGGYQNPDDSLAEHIYKLTTVKDGGTLYG